MKLKDIVKQLDLLVLTESTGLDVEVAGGYTSDLLSDVMANGEERDVWITLQIHLNIVAVARLKELAGIILVNNRRPDVETRKKAEAEGLPLLVSRDGAFEVSGKLYRLLHAGD